MLNSYQQKVIGIDYTNLIGFWDLGELTGTTANDYSSRSNNGSFSGVTLDSANAIDGKRTPSFDGINDFVNIYTGGFASDFNGAEGAVMVWIKVANVGVWTDGTTDYIFNARVNNSNYIRITKMSLNSTLIMSYVAGGTAQSKTQNAFSYTGWLSIGISWSATNDEVKFYVNNYLIDTQTGLGTWSGSLGATTSVFGAFNIFGSIPWNGYLSSCAIWKDVLTESQMFEVSRVG